MMKVFEVGRSWVGRIQGQSEGAGRVLRLQRQLQDRLAADVCETLDGVKLAPAGIAATLTAEDARRVQVVLPWLRRELRAFLKEQIGASVPRSFDVVINVAGADRANRLETWMEGEPRPRVGRSAAAVGGGTAPARAPLDAWPQRDSVVNRAQEPTELFQAQSQRSDANTWVDQQSDEATWVDPDSPEESPGGNTRICGLRQIGSTNLVWSVPGPLAEIGRSANADVVIDDPSVSRSHLRIQATDLGPVAVLHEHTANGLRVDGERVSPGTPVMLQQGTRLRLSRSCEFEVALEVSP